MKIITPAGWPYHAPDNTVIYAIGDLHGHLAAHNLLYAIIENEIAKSPDKSHIIIYLGDYIDRGPHSAQLIEKLISFKKNTNSAAHYFLIGNHEAGLLGFCEDPHGYANWLEYGGIETAISYGIPIHTRAIMPSEREDLQKNLQKLIPKEHWDFYRQLDDMLILGDYSFVHAGIRPDTPIEQQSKKDMRFIREPFLSWDQPLEKFIVHGHTISKNYELRPHRLGLDTGLYQTGLLSCGIFEKNTVKILQIDANR